VKQKVVAFLDATFRSPQKKNSLGKIRLIITRAISRIFLRKIRQRATESDSRFRAPRGNEE